VKTQLISQINGKSRDKRSEESMNRRKVQLFLLERWVWIIAIVVFIFFFGPSINDLIRIFRMYAAYGVLAIAVGISLLCGSTDASSPAIGGFAGVFVVEFGEIWFPGAPPILLLLLPLIIGAAVGAINGLIVSRTRVHSFFVTLATYLIFIGSRKLIREGTLWIRYSDSLLLLGREIIGELDFSIVLLLFVTFLTWLLLNYTRIGVRLYAIGGDATSARLMGINVENMRLFVHTLVGVMAGLSGLIYVGDVGATSPEMMDLWLFWIFAMVIFGGIALEGGRGNIENIVAGMFFISSLDIGARRLGIPVHLIHFIIGALILLGIIVNLIVDKLRDRLLMPSR
jgi:ribose transport system permease protein